jgi:hypothetical protein
MRLSGNRLSDRIRQDIDLRCVGAAQGNAARVRVVEQVISPGRGTNGQAVGVAFVAKPC